MYKGKNNDLSLCVLCVGLPICTKMKSGRNRKVPMGTYGKTDKLRENEQRMRKTRGTNARLEGKIRRKIRNKVG